MKYKQRNLWQCTKHFTLTVWVAQNVWGRGDRAHVRCSEHSMVLSCPCSGGRGRRGRGGGHGTTRGGGRQAGRRGCGCCDGATCDERPWTKVRSAQT